MLNVNVNFQVLLKNLTSGDGIPVLYSFRHTM